MGFETNDDAGVYLISETKALVQSVDFFTPIVDDPYQFGQISAANSLSDIYAMGADPVSALTIVGFPRSGQSFDILEQILQGGLNKMMEAGCTVVGGHSIGDDEIKFGYAVTGLIDPKRIIRNVGARAGDVLVLTKPLGTGVMGTALKQEALSDAALQTFVKWMNQLNREASEIARSFEIHAMTDVTGFGLLGHAREMARGSGVTLEFDHRRIPAIDGAVDCIRRKFIPGGLINNRRFLEPLVRFELDVPEEIQTLLFDPQTSGGLLIAVANEQAEKLVSALRERNVAGFVIGRALDKGSSLLRVV